MTRPRLALTMGDPSGVGPEIIVKALADESVRKSYRIIIVGDIELLKIAAERFAAKEVKRALNRAAVFADTPPAEELKDKSISVISLSGFNARGPGRIIPGKPGPEEGRAMRAYIEAAVKLVGEKAADAIVTAPVTKKAMLEGGSEFGGHTELLAALAGAERVIMMLVNGSLRVALVTTHVPLTEVPAGITRESVLSTIIGVNEGLRKNFGIAMPTLLVAGLNPHAGEGGVMGHEEGGIIAPAVAMAQEKKILVQGPLPPDTIFTRHALRLADAIICMYHDQGLIPVKMRGIERTVNITLGLPFVRTSPGHGTAPNIAWKGKASEKSMLEAVRLAGQMVKNRKKQV